MKTLFIEPPMPLGYCLTRDQAGKFGTMAPPGTVFPPLDFAYAAAVLEKNAYDFEIIDAPALNLSSHQVLEKVSTDQPILVVINTSAISIASDLNIAGLIKKKSPDSLICLTGALASVMPEVVLNNPAVDVAIQGEIEYTIMELLNAIDDGLLQNVLGIAYKKEGAIVRNPARPFNPNLDELPFPAYHCLPIDRYYYTKLPRRPFATMLTSRGCPYKCIYCPYPIAFGSVWRGRSSLNVLDEIQNLVSKLGVKSILFKDQVFTFDIKRAEEICEGIVKRGIDIMWRCETRADRLSENLLSKMKEAGCAGIHMGIESGDPRILSTTAKRGLDINMIRKAFAKAKDIGIETSAFFIIGLPGEERLSIWKSYRLAREIDPDSIGFSMVTPYPGTKLYEIAREKRWILTQDWTRYTLQNVVMRTDELSEQELMRARDYVMTCLGNQNEYLRKTVIEGERVLSMFPPLTKLMKRLSSPIKHQLRRNAERRFERWATQN